MKEIASISTQLKFLILLLCFNTSLAQNFNKSDSIIFETVTKKSGKLKNSLYSGAKFIHTFKKNDSIKVLGYSQHYYFVEINNEKGYVVEDYYFDESKGLRNYRMSIDKLERDSTEVFKERKRKSKEQYEYERKKTCIHDLIKNDEVTGKLMKSTGFHKIASIHDYSLAVALNSVGSTMYVHFNLEIDLGCTSPYKSSRSKVKVILDNEDVITFLHSGDIDCGDEFRLRGKLTSSEGLRLQKSKIKLIRLEGTDSYQDLKEFDYSEFFIDKLKCIK